MADSTWCGPDVARINIWRRSRFSQRNTLYSRVSVQMAECTPVQFDIKFSDQYISSYKITVQYNLDGMQAQRNEPLGLRRARMLFCGLG